MAAYKTSYFYSKQFGHCCENPNGDLYFFWLEGLKDWAGRELKLEQGAVNKHGFYIESENR